MFGRAAALHKLSRPVQVDVEPLSDLLSCLDGVPSLDQHEQPPAHDLLPLGLDDREFVGHGGQGVASFAAICSRISATVRSIFACVSSA